MDRGAAGCRRSPKIASVSENHAIALNIGKPQQLRLGLNRESKKEEETEGDESKAILTEHESYLRFLNASFNSVCLLLNTTGRPSMNKYRMWDRISRRSPSVTTRLAIFPTSIDPRRSATFIICAG